MTKLLNIGIGATGVTLLQIVPDPEQWGAITQIVLQVVISIATLITLFKKKKKP